MDWLQPVPCAVRRLDKVVKSWNTKIASQRAYYWDGNMKVKVIKN